jgi:hypothetical protein
MYDDCLEREDSGYGNLVSTARKYKDLPWLQAVIDDAVQKWTKRDYRRDEMVDYEIGLQIDAYLDMDYELKQPSFEKQTFERCLGEHDNNANNWISVEHCYKEKRTARNTPLPLITASPTGPVAALAVMAGEQEHFIAIIEEARTKYTTASNDMAKGGARAWRKDAICKALPSLGVQDWRGEINTLSSNSDGKGVVEIAIGPGAYIKTWGNALSDVEDHTLIEPNSSLFQILSQMNKGDRVRFSGTFIPNNSDCVRESSLTQKGSMTQPEFIFRFSAVSSD